MKTALITGASGGIGQATARKLASAGWSLYLHFNSDKEGIHHLTEELASLYPEQTFISIQADLSASSGPETLLDQIKIPIDSIVYNCGKSQVGLFQEVKKQTLDAFIQLHLTSLFTIVQQLMTYMIHEKKGKIVVISSIWGTSGASMEVLYSMVKGGQNTFVKALAQEVAPSGISVNAVAPGAVDTQMMAEFGKEDLDFIKEAIPMGRLARPDEIAALVNYLLTPEADYINGQVISINGAWRC
ncbi:SDR family NAD(P)-dependent oxidoreductase [Terrilactibacillus sp. S3-3]|nr:SDR family NAD(P)-dependent oxidoreductase [Terrilactibacillus sp. S3-3]